MEEDYRRLSPVPHTSFQYNANTTTPRDSEYAEHLYFVNRDSSEPADFESLATGTDTRDNNANTSHGSNCTEMHAQHPPSQLLDPNFLTTWLNETLFDPKFGIFLDASDYQTAAHHEAGTTGVLPESQVISSNNSGH